ncbi:MAG: hypothetical protein IIZ39_00820 [Blautia sp.]|nr:hypothetical protein [Blautia sp.]
MVNEKKVRAMTELAMYENGIGKKQLMISKYYRTDYVGQALIRTFFLVTLGYVLLLAAVAAYFSDYLMNNIHKMDLKVLATSVVAGYGGVMILYLFLTFVIYNVRYFRAKKYVVRYYKQLTELSKLYQREERKGGRRR